MTDQLVLEVELPETRETILVPPDQNQDRLTHSLRRAGIALNTRCGERGLCNGCTVELLSGRLIDVSRSETITVEYEPILVRACQCQLDASGPVRIRVPVRSLLGEGPQVVSRFTINVPRAHSPLYQSITLDQHEVTRAEDARIVVSRSFAAHLRAQSPIQCPARAAGQIKRCAQHGGVCVSLEYRGRRWHVSGVSNQPGSPRLGVAIDLGTTTVALLLVDLKTGNILADATDFNRQMQFGDDVITRIALCAQDATMVARLQETAVRETLGPLLEAALRSARRSPADVACLTVAGNTTMLHLLAGVDPASMGTAPFTPTFLRHRIVRSAALQLRPSPDNAKAESSQHQRSDGKQDTRTPARRWACRGGPAVHLLPGAAAYVGADICAGVLASGLVYDDGPSLLVDVGTNGEIVLKHKGRLLGCATAAGPAFEGCGLSCGTRASDGAVSHLRFTSDPFTINAEVIGDGSPIGICGSAYIDFLAHARRIGLINRIGRYNPDALPGAAQRFVRQQNAGLALQVATGAAHQPIVITEADIARLLPAKAAIAAGILTLLARFDLSSAEIKTLYLAGGFGLHVDAANAIGCGLLPGFVSQQVQLLGNSSLAGAYLALLDSDAVEELKRIGRRIRIVELNLDPGFEACYIGQLALPSSGV
jgi:uncharacterized 2Fe-2S/4Fe-4S cluster protein (DUF4445 family)